MENEFWAIIELMGHQKVAGKLSEHVIGGSSFLRIDVPETESQGAFTRLLTDKAIYAINPVTEEVARYSASNIQAKPIESWDFREMLSKSLHMEGKMFVPSSGTTVVVEQTSGQYGDDDDDNPF